MSLRVVIGTRGSALALWQAEHVGGLLRRADPQLTIELKVIRTKGDKIQDVPLAKVGGKGLFVKEIEEALLAEDVDLAVHSMKDVPTELVDGAGLTAILAREDPRDALVSGGAGLAALPAGAVVGTSSLRRRTQLLRHRPDLEVSDLRGNVDTRLRKLAEGRYDAILLAAAGLKRLGFAERIAELLEVERWVPAVGQGALGVETRLADERVNALVGQLHDPATATRVAAERALLARLGGGCQVPIAAHARLEGERLVLRALIGHPRGAPVFEACDRGDPSEPQVLGQRVAEALIAQGADAVLAEVYAAAQDPR